MNPNSIHQLPNPVCCQKHTIQPSTTAWTGTVTYSPPYCPLCREEQQRAELEALREVARCAERCFDGRGTWLVLRDALRTWRCVVPLGVGNP